MGALFDKEYTKSAHVYLVESVNKKLELPSLIFVVRLQSIASVVSKRCRLSAHKRTQTEKKPAVIGNERLKRLNASVINIYMELWDTDSDNENDTDSSYGLSDFGSESDSSDPDISS